MFRNKECESVHYQVISQTENKIYRFFKSYEKELKTDRRS